MPMSQSHKDKISAGLKAYHSTCKKKSKPLKKVNKPVNKSIEDYSDDQLRKGAKNWAKVQRVKIKGINNLSRKGLLTLFKKEKVSMDFLKFKIKKKIVYTSGSAGGGQVPINAPGNDPGFYLSKENI